MTLQHIPWHPSEHGGPLGRNLEHDEQSRDYPIRALIGPARARRPVLHRRHIGIYDQGAAFRFRGHDFPNGAGSCTGNSGAGCMSTGPNRHHYHEPTAISLYAQATILDGFPGTFPDQDTGSSGLAVCKALKARGVITEYRHAFSLDDLLDTLQDRPAMVGIKWLTGCDTPDSTGLIHYTGTVRGGHEICAVGHDPTRALVRFANSWGPGWGDRGYFDITESDLAAALADGGDVTVPIAA